MFLKPRMARLALLLAVSAAVLAAAPGLAAEKAAEPPAPGRALARKAAQRPELWITADHSKHDALRQEFASGEAVTAACLTCHNQAASQIHKTIHWTWLDPHEDPAKGIGKGGLITNNF